MHTKSRNYYVAFGGNVETSFGSPLESMTAALRRLATEPVRITAVSRKYDTPAFPEGSGPNFVNGVVGISTSLGPYELLETLHKIEAEFGRERTSRWGARTLDFDILCVGDETYPNEEIWGIWARLPPKRQIIETPDQLILPHPRMQDRAFVLVPLFDVAPDWFHPQLSKSVAEMLADLPDDLKNEVKPL